MHSAFDYAGQKCSAAARVLVHEAIADALIERLAGAVEALQVGQAGDFGTDVPPVIEREAQERVRALRAARPTRTGGSPPRREAPAGRLVLRAARSPPTSPPDSPVLREEIFGPLLAVERVRDVDARRATASTSLPFALTGGLFSRNPRTVERVVGAARRSATSTSTARSPARWSAASRSAATACPGTGTKAGGPDYLLQFVEPRVVTENTVRHGLVV